MHLGVVKLRGFSKGLRYRSAYALRGATTTCGIVLRGLCLRLADDRSRRKSVQVEGVVLKSGSAEVDEQGVGDAGGAEDFIPMVGKGAPLLLRLKFARTPTACH